MTAGRPPAVRASAWDTPPGVSTAGSIYAVAPHLQLSAARLLHAQGRWIHVDVMTEGDRPVGGVPLETLDAVRATLPDAQVEVHLVSRAPGRLDDLLGRVLAARPQRVVLPVSEDGATGALARSVRDRGAQAWAELAPGASVPDAGALRAEVDGALLMLIRPGTRQDADLARLDVARALAHQLTVGVDGGITAGNTSACVAAGAVHLVSGRALLRQVDPIHKALEGAR